MLHLKLPLTSHRLWRSVCNKFFSVESLVADSRKAADRSVLAFEKGEGEDEEADTHEAQDYHTWDECTCHSVHLKCWSVQISYSSIKKNKKQKRTVNERDRTKMCLHSNTAITLGYWNCNLAFTCTTSECFLRQSFNEFFLKQFTFKYDFNTIWLLQCSA